MKVFLLSGSPNYINWIEGAELCDNIIEADLVLFEGGEDVHYSLYSKYEHPKSYSNLNRDMKEIEVFYQALSLGIPMLGVCRGAQFGCVMSGGKLVQDQPNPGAHLMKYLDENNEVKEILVTSTHHQAQYPFNLSDDQYKILGWTESMLGHHEDGSKQEMNPVKECEVVYYTYSNFLAIQPHPEMMIYNREVNNPKFKQSIAWFRKILNDFLNK